MDKEGDAIGPRFTRRILATIKCKGQLSINIFLQHSEVFAKNGPMGSGHESSGAHYSRRITLRIAFSVSVAIWQARGSVVRSSREIKKAHFVGGLSPDIHHVHILPILAARA